MGDFSLKKAIVTGPTSFIGESLINRLIAEGYYVYAVVRPNSKKKQILVDNENTKVIQLSMGDYFKLDELINAECDYFISLAWDGTRGTERNDKRKQQENYNDSMKALRAALRLNCKRVISAGSQAEYGFHNSIITEDTICSPNTEYGKAKLQFYESAYKICTDKGVSFKEPRFFSLFGPKDYESSMVISIINKMLKNEDCELTQCTQMWNFLYISDAIDGMIKLMETDCEDGPYNFGSNDSRKLKDFIEQMRLITNSTSILRYGAIPYNTTNGIGINPSINKLCSQTGWQPKVSFCDGIRRTVEYIRNL